MLLAELGEGGGKLQNMHESSNCQFSRPKISTMKTRPLLLHPSTALHIRSLSLACTHSLIPDPLLEDHGRRRHRFRKLGQQGMSFHHSPAIDF
jgi:hypothetical protein